MTYAFPQFPDVLFEDPVFYLNRVNDLIPLKSCYVELCCEYNGETYSFDFDGFLYEDTWEDSDAFSFAMSKMDNFRVD